MLTSKNKKIHKAHYQQIIQHLLHKKRNQKINFGTFINILNDNNIKLYCKEDIIKISKIFMSPLDKIRLQQPLNHLKFMSVRKTINTTIYLVTMSGRQNKQTQNTNNHNQLMQESFHSIINCLKVLKQRLYVLYGNQTRWFQYIGGIPTTTKINKDLFMIKVDNLLRNTQHYQCISRILLYLCGEEDDKHVQWLEIRGKLNNKITVELDRSLKKNCSRLANSLSDHTSRKQQWKNILRFTRNIRIKTEFSKQKQKQQILIKRSSFEKIGEGTSIKYSQTPNLQKRRKTVNLSRKVVRSITEHKIQRFSPNDSNVIKGYKIQSIEIPTSQRIAEEESFSDICMKIRDY